MDNQFNTLSRSYSDNYVQYSLTGVKSYKTAYESAYKGLQDVIVAKQAEVDEEKKNIDSALGADAVSLFHSNQAGLGSLTQGIHDSRDRVKAAEMRIPAPAPKPDYTDKYITLMALLGGLAIVQFL
jgi:hypothetical protein